MTFQCYQFRLYSMAKMNRLKRLLNILDVYFVHRKYSFCFFIQLETQHRIILHTKIGLCDYINESQDFVPKLARQELNYIHQD